MRVSPRLVSRYAERAHQRLLTPARSFSEGLLPVTAVQHPANGTHPRLLRLQHTPASDRREPFPPFQGAVEISEGRDGFQRLHTPEVQTFPPLKFGDGRKPGPRLLPISCPGCGALTQEADPKEAGFYTQSRKAVRNFVRVPTFEPAAWKCGTDTTLKERSLLHGARDKPSLDWLPPAEDKLPEQKSPPPVEFSTNSTTTLPPLPVCDRCHDLLYNARGTSIAHPSIDSLASSIAESPFRHNHIYHVLDAADFPLSLIPSIYSQLSLAKPRTQNRRSQHTFSKRPTISFIITRSDLLAPRKEIVDSLMPYFTSVLRGAMGKFAEHIRLGNVHLVSSKRGWWTRDIKESVWKRGGGNWLIGKVNVGKSNLFEVLFPKGSGERAPSHAELERGAQKEGSSPSKASDLQGPNGALELLPETSLLPPPQPETPFPVLPLVSSLPGTTASPIRLSFGNHKGELIDLPGLPRGNLNTYIKAEHRSDLVMTHRPTVTQYNVKPSQSLLLGGGLIRITPAVTNVGRDAVVLAYPFVPISAHVTATEKATGTQLQQRESGIKSILSSGAGEKMASAGIFKLETDVTKARARPLLRAGVKVEQLPFRVFATDILLEGVGWVELVCQVRRRKRDFEETSGVFDSGETDALSHLDETSSSSGISERKQKTVEASDEFPKPEVEIFTPEGKHVGQRKSMGAWLLLNQTRNSKEARKATHAARPRKSMKGAKKVEKLAKRAADATKGNGQLLLSDI